MAITLLQSAGNSLSYSVNFINPSPVLLSISISPTTSGSFIVVGIQFDGNLTLNISSVTDNVGNSYARISAASTSSQGTDLWYSNNVLSGATSITASLTIVGSAGTFAGHMRGVIAEYSGVSTSSPFYSPAYHSPAGDFNGATLTSVHNPDILIATGEGSDTVTINPPWTTVHVSPSANGAAIQLGQYAPGVAGTYTITFSSTSYGDSSGIVLLDASFHILTLSDSITSSDALAVARAENVSDSMTVTDSFSLQSSFIASNPISTVETLTNNLIPAETKTFYKFE